MLFSPCSNRSCREYVYELMKVYFNLFFRLHHIRIEFDLMLNALVIFWCKVKFGQFSSYWDFKKSPFYFQGRDTIFSHIDPVWFGQARRVGETVSPKRSSYSWLRLYFMMGLKLVKTQMMVFFTAKNILTVIVYGYRNIWYVLTISIPASSRIWRPLHHVFK